MKEIFISYSSADIEQATTVRTVLEKNSLSCWMAPRDIPGAARAVAVDQGSDERCSSIGIKGAESLCLFRRVDDGRGLGRGGGLSSRRLEGYGRMGAGERAPQWPSGPSDPLDCR